MSERDLYLLNFTNGVAAAVLGEIAGLSDSQLATRLGVSEWKARLLRRYPENWTIDNVSDLMLTVGAELTIQPAE